MRKRFFLAACLLMLAVSISLTTVTVSAQTCDSSDEAEFMERGDFKFNSEDWQGAIDEYTCALELNPENTDALFNRAYAYAEIYEYTEAEADLNALFELEPNNFAAYNNLANIYYSRGDYETALEYYDSSIELFSGDPIPFYNRASLHFEMGDYEAALEDADRGFEVDPRYIDGFLVQARIYQGLDDPRYNQRFDAWVHAIQQQTEEIDGTQALKDYPVTMTEGLVFEVPLVVEEGQVIQAAARTNRDIFLDSLLLLRNEAGDPVASDDDSGVNLDAVLEYTVPESGTYTLFVTHSNGGSEGPLLLTVSVGGEAAVGAEAEAFIDFGLVVNTPAVVFTTEGDRLNLRSGPGLNFDILTKLDRDSQVTLLEGPKKADGYAWWRVRAADGTEGWAVERVETEQTLQLALVIGQEAVVTSTEGDLLRIREGAGRSFEIIVQLEPGTVVTILEGPQIADDLSWWKIRTADGTEGWAVERVADDRTLARQQAETVVVG
jgi:tetratricopeptide (TPR) repeat protein/uncharacterized protein YgiM (DUF1202 family)